MKKLNVTLIMMLLAVSLNSNAQVNYLFSASSRPYVPVTGGISPHLTSDYPGVWEVEDEGFANVPIGFTFNYNGKNYTRSNIDMNGFITFEGTLDIGYNYQYFLNHLAFGPNFDKRPLIAAFWDDLLLPDSMHLVYKTTGHAPFRVFTVEWKQAKWVYESLAPVLSIELKLYETTNIIEFHYKDEGGLPDPRYAFASIGITSSYINRDFISLQNTSSNPPISLARANDSLTVKPANNQVYRFIPSLLNKPGNIEKSLKYTNHSVSFKMDAGGCNSFEYAVTQSQVAPLSGTNTFSQNVTVNSLLPATTYYIYARTHFLNLLHSQWVCDSFITASNPEPLPYIANEAGVGYPDYYLPADMRNQDFMDTTQYDDDPTYGWGTYADYPNVGDRGFYAIGYNHDADVWMFTPGFNLTAGKSYLLEFGYNAYPFLNPTDSASLEIKYGPKTGEAGMISGTLFDKSNITNPNFEDIWRDTIIEIIPSVSGVYYLGFHYKNTFQGAEIDVHNITLKEKPLLRVALNDNANTVAVYPNPVKDMLTVNIEAANAAIAQMMVSDVTGKIVINKEIKLQQGVNDIQLNTRNLNAGNYLLKIICNDGCENVETKFVKQ